MNKTIIHIILATVAVSAVLVAIYHFLDINICDDYKDDCTN